MSESGNQDSIGIGDATEIVQEFVDEYQDGEWKRVVKTKSKPDRWKIYFRTSEYNHHQSISVDKESGNIVRTDLAG